MKAAFSFARMNPMTTAHMMLVEDMSKLDVDMSFIYLSHKQDKKNKKDVLKNKNPLDYETKYSYVKTFIEENNIHNVDVVYSSSRTLIESLKEVNEKYDELIIVCGSDRFEEYRTLIDKYNYSSDKENTTNNYAYKFSNIEYHLVGDKRDPDSEGLSGMSASKMRKLACEGNFEEFRLGVPTESNDLAYQLYEDIRKAML